MQTSVYKYVCHKFEVRLALRVTRPCPARETVYIGPSFCIIF